MRSQMQGSGLPTIKTLGKIEEFKKKNKQHRFVYHKEDQECIKF